MALVPDQKFSTFINGNDLEVGDIIVGLRNGLNTRFTYTGNLPVGVIIPIINGGTGADNAVDARTNLGLGTMAIQDAIAVAITGGTIAGVAITASTIGTSAISGSTITTATITNSTASLTSGQVAAVPAAADDIVNKAYADSIVGALVGGSNTAIQYNNSGVFGGDNNFTTNGSGTVGIVGQLTVDNLLFDGNKIEATNTNGNITLVADGTGNVDIFSPPASETSSIRVNGVDYNIAFRVNDVGTASPAQAIIHRHSTTLEPVLLFARANSDVDAHANVTSNMALSSIYASGWTGTQYSLFGQIRIGADSTGTISDTSAPGRIQLLVTPNGSITPVSALSISNAGVTTLANALPIGSGGTGLNSSPTNGQLLIGNGSGYTLATLTAGTNVSITNGAGSITIDATGGGGDASLSTIMLLMGG